MIVTKRVLRDRIRRLERALAARPRGLVISVPSAAAMRHDGAATFPAPRSPNFTLLTNTADYPITVSILSVEPQNDITVSPRETVPVHGGVLHQVRIAGS